MKDSMLKFMKYALVGLGVLLALLVVVGVVLAMDWPWWVALFLVLLIAGGVIGWFVARRIMARRREQAFATDVAAEEEKRIAKLPAADLGNARLLRERWKDAVDTLKNSHLKKQGNPLYVLPWYLVIGESGSGKTTSLSSARLPSPFGAGRGNSAVSGTMNCDWWFCEESIIIDTAGRYSVPVDEARDREEWSNFLRLLSKYRRREPLNGVVLTVSVDRLLDGGDERLEEEGRTMRRRMDELMRSLGVRVPVYLLVTKCDLIRGMTRFSSLLPEKILTQPMGMMKQDEGQDPEVFARAAMKTVGERLRNLRLLLLRERPQTDSAVLLFPEEFQSMTEGLASFMKGAFRENPYQETPFLRGVFFGSGRQEGRERSRFAADLREAGDETLPGTARGFFLHDLFARILPSERALLAPTKKFMEWQHATGNLALVSFVVVAIALSGLLTFSFVRNLNTIRGFSRQFATIPGLKGEMVNVSEMERFRQAILKVEEGNRNWWIPRFGLTESLNVEASLKKAYCRRFRDNFLAGVDRQLLANLQGMTEATPDEQFGRTVLHLARRINILNARRDGKNLDKMASMPQPPYLAVSLEEGKLFGPLYLSYIQWLSETGDLGRDLETLQAGLKRLVPVKGTNVRWLATAVDNHSGLPAITLGDYWNGASPAGMPFISPSFTAKGKQAAEAMSSEIVSALGDSGSLLRRDDFRRWYGAAVQEQWRAFAVAFPRGIDGLKGERSWQEVAVKMATNDNPCFSFLTRVGSELTALSEGAPQQAWVAQAVRLQQARLAGKAAPLTKAAEGGKKVLAGLEKVVGKETQVQQFDVTSGPRGWVEYTTALAAIAPAAASRNQAYQLTAQVFADPGAPTPFRNAFQAADKLSRFAGNGLPADDAVARLVWTPADFLWKHVRKETAALLQAQWDEQVVAGTAGLPPQQAMALLAGPDGTAWRFVKGPAAPFLARSGGRGFYPREALGGTIPLDVSLFSFLEKGAKAQAAVMTRQANYNVGIKGLPTEANGEAKAQPHGTRLELQCAGAPQVLVNNNYPVGKTFYWSPDTCSDVSLQIEVGDVTVSKRYMGTTGFSDFLQDFQSGQRTFLSREFPGERQALEKLGIKYIKVSYLFTGGGAVLKQATALNGAVPRSIAR